MSDDKRPKLDELVAGHDYDGIQEFNNPAPFWWQLFFYISIVFGIGYIVYYEFLGGPTLNQELSAKLEKIQALQVKSAGQGPDEAKLLAALTDPAQLAVGKKVFVEKCAACHLVDGGGLIGPNLTDNYWIHGKGAIMALYPIVRDGVLDKGMPPWGAILSTDEIIGVLAYIKSLKGQPVATPKAPQGELISE